MICVSLQRAPQYTTFACCLIPVLTLAVLLLVMLEDINDISFSKRRYFLIVLRMNISVYGIPTRDTHITRDMCTAIHISRGYTCHCHTWSGSTQRNAKGKTQKFSKGLSVRKFTQTCKCLRTDAFKLHIYICTKKGSPPCAGKLYQLMSKKNVLKSRSIVNMTAMYWQYPPRRTPGIWHLCRPGEEGI